MVAGTQVGAYRVVQRIGSGGMGEVWIAEHAVLGRRAAIKVLHAALASQAEVIARFLNEARAASAIADPGIVQIFDFGTQEGNVYIAMELLDGEPLDRRLARLGALAVGDALRITRQVASSLEAAHARGIVHRDLKPENIYLVRDPEVAGGERAKILDFGIAKLSGDQAGVKTRTAALMGTPLYMSPEQCRGAGLVDRRADIYSLGCVLFALIAGRPPFQAEGAGDLIAMHLREPAPAVSGLASGVSREVDALVARCLAKDPSQRFASGGELAAAIGALITGAVTAPAGGTRHLPAAPRVAAGYTLRLDENAPARAADANGARGTTLSSVAAETLPPPSSQRKASPLVVLAGVAVAAGLAGLFIFGGSRGSAPPRPQPGAVVASPATPPPAPPPPTTLAPAPPPAVVAPPKPAEATASAADVAAAPPKAAAAGSRPARPSRSTTKRHAPPAAAPGADDDIPDTR